MTRENMPHEIFTRANISILREISKDPNMPNMSKFCDYLERVFFADQDRQRAITYIENMIMFGVAHDWDDTTRDTYQNILNCLKSPVIKEKIDGNE